MKAIILSVSSFFLAGIISVPLFVLSELQVYEDITAGAGTTISFCMEVI